MTSLATQQSTAINAALNHEGLRLASSDEAGWYVSTIVDGELIRSLWVCESTPDHDAEAARADAAIRSLHHALAGLTEAHASLVALSTSPDVADALLMMRDIEIKQRLIADLIRRETARRDAAELAARVAR